MPHSQDTTPESEDVESGRAFALLFQAWVLLVLLILSIAFLQYLLLKVSR